jgi:CheY-like chemotaxis protein
VGKVSGVKKNISLTHWKAGEAKPLIALLEQAGYTVHYAGDRKPMRMTELRKLNPVAAVVDLSRMPSYGKYWAAEVRASSLKHLPILFVDGDAEKVAQVKAALPDATFTSRDKLVDALKRAKPVSNPVAPSRMMASTRSVALKMGIKPGQPVAVFNAPPGYPKIIGVLPEGAKFEEEPKEPAPVAVWFVRELDAYLSGLREMRKLAAQSRLWVLYPKQKKGKRSGITQFDLRESAIQAGLVDFKICSVDETWTGMAFAVKKNS